MPENKTQTRQIVLETDPRLKRGMPTGKSWFFGIGINNYKHFSDLNNAVRDVVAIRELLEDQYDIGESIILLDQQATRRNIIRALDRLVTITGTNDKIIILYSGHGHLSSSKKGYWIPHDAELGFTDDYIPNSRLRDYMEDLPVKHILLISDSCFSGSLFVQGATRRNPEPEELLEQKNSRYAFCSGRHDEEVFDGPAGLNSPFASSIIEILQENQADKLRISFLAEKVMNRTASQYRQLPRHGTLFSVGDKGGQYVFRRKIKMPTWLNTWKEINELGESNLLEIKKKLLQAIQYLDTYPDAENISVVEEKCEYLEAKMTFFEAKGSMVKLRKFARQKTPFQEEAIRLLEENKKGLVIHPEAKSHHEEVEAPLRPEQQESAKSNKVEKKEKTKPKPSPRPKLNFGSFTDSRDGQVYKTLEINGQIWMAENLNFEIEDSWNYDNDPKIGKKYGRLYTWDSAQKACPPGCKVPTDQEWQTLLTSLGGFHNAKSGILNIFSKSTGKNSIEAYRELVADGISGFDALLSGWRDPRGGFNFLEQRGYYWSVTEKNKTSAWYYCFNSLEGKVFRYNYFKSYGQSCRCIVIGNAE